MQVLIAEDDRHTRAGLAEVLDEEGYEVTTARNGKETLEAFERESPDLISLDIMMPGVDGYEICRRIRREGSEVPIIFISAKSEEIDRVLGLELGADDFIVKPFGVREVIARVRAVARRCVAGKESAEVDTPFTIGELEVVPSELRAYRGNETIDLSPRDLSILRLFAANEGEVLDRNTIYNECWGIDYMPDSRALDQHISQLRKRIEIDPGEPRIIRTVHGVGYRYDGVDSNPDR